MSEIYDIDLDPRCSVCHTRNERAHGRPAILADVMRMAKDEKSTISQQQTREQITIEELAIAAEQAANAAESAAAAARKAATAARTHAAAAAARKS